MLKYNICFIRRGDEILLLNRERSSWMGRWNGIGGKLEHDEAPRIAMQRELEEETGITAYTLHFKGLVTWSSRGSHFGGMYLYLADVAQDLDYPTPIKMDEGILDWKSIDWILHEENGGVASNIPKVLGHLLRSDGCFDHHCFFVGDHIEAQIATEMPAEFESDNVCRERYLDKYRAFV
jgi:8-oxo-dGTP diphosphatase